MKSLPLFFTIILLIACNSLTAQVAVNTNGDAPDGSAMLDVQSTNKGLLPPCMSEAERNAISSPAAGLMIYNTTSNSFDFFNGIKWISTTESGVVAQNLPPVASNVSFSGTLRASQTLTGSYTYSDYESDAEGTSTFKWYRADDASGTGQVTIGGANSISYELSLDDYDKYISFEVIPVAQTGDTPGTAVASAYQGPIAYVAVGDFYGGGVVYYVNGTTGLQVCSVYDISTGASWGCVGINIPGASGQPIGTGAQNTWDIINGCSTAGIAARICDDLTLNGFDDWFLPARNELTEMHDNAAVINATSIANGGTAFINTNYWSSSEHDDNNGLQVNLVTNNVSGTNKANDRHVRAVRAYPAPNLAPYASNVSFSGTIEIGETLTGSYTYNDQESDPEGTSTFKWYRADDVTGTNQVVIGGANALTYVLVTADGGKYISFEVTPVALTGPSPGTAVMAAYQEVAVTTVYNPTTGETWMDRNLGASQVATSSADAASFGDFYQWGRATEGHEKGTSTITTTNATTAVPNDGNSWDGLFIIEPSSPYNWLVPFDNTLWQGVTGVNNPCPTGFRIPAKSEWQSEVSTWTTGDVAGAFSSILKLPAAGARDAFTGVMTISGDGLYWTSDIPNDVHANRLHTMSSSYDLSYSGRANGFSIRCIKD